jgi:predicted membrane channel-forming protein YqfA (hemolysin III family)
MKQRQDAYEQGVLRLGILMVSLLLFFAAIAFFPHKSPLQNAALMISIMVFLYSLLAMFKSSASSRYR